MKLRCKKVSKIKRQHSGIYAIILLVVTLIYACEPTEEQFTSDPSVKLQFSTDSVVFDTLFSSIGSITKRFWVYNQSEKAVNISSIDIREDNGYSLIVNGIEGNSLANIRLLGEDSLLVLISVTIDPQDENLPFLVTNYIDFITNGNEQFVNLVAWGQDAHFIPKGILDCDISWTNERPYVLLDSVLIPESCKLTVQAGTRIYANTTSAIIVAGTLEANGSYDERILISNSRLDEDYKNAPGQWPGIIFAETSASNHINCTDIRNAVNGIWLGTPDDDLDYDLTLSNSKIENMSGVGLLAFTSDLYAYNTLINNCGQHLVANFAGGNYRYEHCTFSNLSNELFDEGAGVVIADNFPISDSELLVDEVNLVITNSIIWGGQSNELILSNDGNQNFELAITNNIIRTSNNSFEASNILNEDPKFINPSEYDFSLDTLSIAKDNGILLEIRSDIQGNNRDDNPDIGAYERIE